MENFTPTKNRTTLISNEILEINRYKLKMNAQKVLIGLAQSIDHTVDMFPELEIDIEGMWSFLDIAGRTDRYTLIRDALFEITENPLQIKISEKKWSSIPWMSVEYDEADSKYVKICFHEKAKPYLLELKEYTKVKGLYISRLQSHYSTWLYPILKMIQTKYHGTHEISIERLKEYTFTDNVKENPAYNISKAATNNFLQRVVGVKSNPKTKQIEIIKNSPLWDINEKTDIVVSVLKITKEGQKYKGLIFHITSKQERNGITSGFDKNQYVSTIPKQTVGSMRVSLKTVFEYAKASGITAQEYCDRAGYFIKENYAYKKLTEQQYNDYMKAKEPKEKRGRQMSIYDVINKKNDPKITPH